MGIDDDIRLDIKSDTSEGERARETLERVKRETDQLKASFEQGRVGLDNYKSALRDLGREAKQAETALKGFEDAANRSGQIRLTGAERVGAKARLGLAGANILQDGIQGGPASTINNVLGLAGDGGVKALGAEAVAAAGGLAAIATTCAVVAVAAGAMFVTIDQGLKAAKLDWTDFDDVVGNLAPIHAATDALEGLGVAIDAGMRPVEEMAKSSGFSDAFYSADRAILDIIATIDEYTIGWNRATEAAKVHKDELERGAKAARDYTEAVKELSKFQSKEEKAKDATGKLTGQALADLGGAGGVDGLVDRLAKKATDRGGDDKVTVQREVMKDGKGTGQFEDVEITRREAMKRQIMADLEAARKGDPNAIGRTVAGINGLGLDPAAFLDATKGIDRDKEAKADDKTERGQAREQRQADADAEREMEEAGRKWDARLKGYADPLQERFNRLSARGDMPDKDGVIRQLKVAGLDDVQAGAVAPDLLAKLKTGYDEAVTKKALSSGLSRDAAAKALADEADAKDRDKAESAADGKKRDQVEQARKLTAGEGLDDRVQDALARYALAGANREDGDRRVRDQLSSELQGRGQSREDAEAAAESIVAKASAKLGDEVMAGSMKPPEMRGPERIDAGSFAASVERAGADTAKQSLDTLKEMKGKLSDILRATQESRRIGP